uniref:Late endosomal/lysosomal adaptor and MAPK and MTOR activator 1 n=1 Tax=Trichuris muris TaxID=70415 RepID=A0A5S6Q8H6_TRIMR
MTSTSCGSQSRRSRLFQGGSHPDAVTDISQSAERDDSRVDVANLADAVASLTRQVTDLHAVVMALKPHPETPASLKTSPEVVYRTSELQDTAKQGRDRIVQDTLWFEEPTNTPRSVGGTPVIRNPWVQQISTDVEICCILESLGCVRRRSEEVANFQCQLSIADS